MPKWRDIKTAPKIGTQFLVTGGTVEDDLSGPEPYKIALVERSNTNYFSMVHGCYYSVWVNNPTHWMPLPPPPETTK